MARFPQLDLQPARPITAFVVVKNRHHFRLQDRFARSRGPGRLRQPLGVVAAGHHPQNLAKLLDRVKRPLLVNEMQRTHGVGDCEKMAMAFFKISSSCASRVLAERCARTSAASAGSVSKGGWAAFYQA